MHPASNIAGRHASGRPTRSHSKCQQKVVVAASRFKSHLQVTNSAFRGGLTCSSVRPSVAICQIISSQIYCLKFVNSAVLKQIQYSSINRILLADCYVLLAVYLGTILVNNQLDSLCVDGRLVYLHTRRSSTQSDINQVSH